MFRSHSKKDSIIHFFWYFWMTISQGCGSCVVDGISMLFNGFFFLRLPHRSEAVKQLPE
jgi:hypothetical protein